jgi:hypothetical protein
MNLTFQVDLIDLNEALDLHRKLDYFIDLLEVLDLKDGADRVFYRASETLGNRYMEFALRPDDSKYKDI